MNILEILLQKYDKKITLYNAIIDSNTICNNELQNQINTLKKGINKLDIKKQEEINKKIEKLTYQIIIIDDNIIYNIKLKNVCIEIINDINKIKKYKYIG